MKLWQTLLAGVGLIVSMAAFGATEPAVIDTGKNGLRLTLNIPQMDGPYDFARNKGPKIARIRNNSFIVGEAMFNTKIEGMPTTTVVNKLSVIDKKTLDSATEQKVTAEILAREILKSAGFDLSRAEPMKTPPVQIPGVTVVSYKATGQPRFGDITRDDKSFLIVQAVSFPGEMKGYAIMTNAIEDNPAAFDADPAKYEAKAKGGFMLMFKGLTVTEN